MGVATVVPVVEAMGRAMLGTPLISTTLAAQLVVARRRRGPDGGRAVRHCGGTTATVALLENTDWGDTRLACTLGADGVLRGGKKFVTDATAARLFVVVVDCRGAPALALVRARNWLPAL